MAYIYCVGSRQDADVESAQRVLLPLLLHRGRARLTQVAAKPGKVHQYHLHRDVRTYGKYELLYDESLNKGSVYRQGARRRAAGGARATRRAESCS